MSETDMYDERIPRGRSRLGGAEVEALREVIDSTIYIELLQR
jgi:hypothetical protein